VADANSFRHRLTPQNTTVPVHGKRVDERRSGVQARDGYAVLSQARPAGDDSPYGFGSRNRPTMTPKVYDRGNFDYGE
jgi:hypothetical protein